MLLWAVMLVSACSAGASMADQPDFQTFKHEDPNTGRVLECNRCPPGTYLRGNCVDDTGESDCARCPPGSFTEIWNYIPKCLRCGICAGNQVTRTECSASRDCQCQCKDGYYFNRRMEDCARFKECPAGQGVVKPGTPEQDSECETCPSGFFSGSVSAYDPCAAHSTCQAPAQLLVLKGRTWHDAVCASCHQLTSQDGSEFLRQILPGFMAHHKIGVKKMRRFLLRNTPAGTGGPPRATVMQLGEKELVERMDRFVRTATGDQIRQLPQSLRKIGIFSGADKLQRGLTTIEQLEELCRSR